MSGANLLSTVQPPALLGVAASSSVSFSSPARRLANIQVCCRGNAEGFEAAAPAHEERLQFRRRDSIGGCVGTAVGLELFDRSTRFTGVATAADLIERRQRSEFQSSIKNTIYTAIKPKPELIPSLLTLALNDAITYDKATKAGGANGSVRLEISRPENNGLSAALDLLVEAEKEIDSYSKGGPISFADLIQFAEMKDRFIAVGLGPHQLAVMSAFLGPDQSATEERLIADPDCHPWVDKYQRSRDIVSRTDYEVDLITTLTKLSSLGQKINYEAYTYPKQKIDLTKLKL